MIFRCVLNSDRGTLCMETGVYWRFVLPEEVQRRTIRGDQAVGWFEFHQLVGDRGYDDDDVHDGRHERRETG